MQFQCRLFRRRLSEHGRWHTLTARPENQRSRWTLRDLKAGAVGGRESAIQKFPFKARVTARAKFFHHGLTSSSDIDLISCRNLRIACARSISFGGPVPPVSFYVGPASLLAWSPSRCDSATTFTLAKGISPPWARAATRSTAVKVTRPSASST